MPSASGRRKAFSTRGSHLTLLFTGYGSTIFLDGRPGKAHSVDLNKTVALVTSVLTPCLNPFILTLRNETFKAVLRGQVQRLKDLHKARPQAQGTRQHSVKQCCEQAERRLAGKTTVKFLYVFPLSDNHSASSVLPCLAQSSHRPPYSLAATRTTVWGTRRGFP